SGASENATGMSMEGNTGRSTTRAVPNPVGTVLIPIEEVSTNADMVVSLLNVFNGTGTGGGVAGITVGAEGNRANWLGPIGGDFSELESRGVFVDQNSTGETSGPNIIGIPFLAHDQDFQIAQRMATAINGVAG